MRKLTCIAAFLFLSLSVIGQDSIDEVTRQLEEEGKRLYRSEMASWYGTDLFLEKYTAREKIGGYLSYPNKDAATCIFFSKGDKPKVIGTISFDSTYNIHTAKADLTERDFTADEQSLYTIRTHALRIIRSDTLFKVYENTSLNLIPLISNGEKKVYVLTGPKKTGVVIFGNDYLLTFDDDNKLIDRKRLHKNMISINYGKTEDGSEITGAMHSHLPETGDFITATDICTLMLYAKFAKWEQHTVVSANYISFWNCVSNQLVILTKEAVEKINKDQEKRHKKDKN